MQCKVIFLWNYDFHPHLFASFSSFPYTGEELRFGWSRSLVVNNKMIKVCLCCNDIPLFPKQLLLFEIFSKLKNEHQEEESDPFRLLPLIPLFCFFVLSNIWTISMVCCNTQTVTWAMCFICNYVGSKENALRIFKVRHRTRYDLLHP